MAAKPKATGTRSASRSTADRFLVRGFGKPTVFRQDKRQLVLRFDALDMAVQFNVNGRPLNCG